MGIQYRRAMRRFQDNKVYGALLICFALMNSGCTSYSNCATIRDKVDARYNQNKGSEAKRELLKKGEAAERESVENIKDKVWQAEYKKWHDCHSKNRFVSEISEKRPEDVSEEGIVGARWSAIGMTELGQARLDLARKSCKEDDPRIRGLMADWLNSYMLKRIHQLRQMKVEERNEKVLAYAEKQKMDLDVASDTVINEVLIDAKSSHLDEVMLSDKIVTNLQCVAAVFDCYRECYTTEQKLNYERNNFMRVLVKV